MMAFVQACFGLGGTFAPFLSTAFAANVDRAWYYYFVAMGVAIVAVIVMLLAFNMRTEEQLIQPAQSDQAEPQTRSTDENKMESDNAAEAPVEQTKASSGAKMKRIFKTPFVYPLMGFSFLYVSIACGARLTADWRGSGY